VTPLAGQKIEIENSFQFQQEYREEAGTCQQDFWGLVGNLVSPFFVSETG
jgi:hypothetical protein